MSEPTISVVIASFGPVRWQALAQTRALPSTEGQGFLEVICPHLPNGTLSEARNEGAKEASGDYICFLDADDELTPGFADAMRSAIKSTAGGGANLYTPAVQYIHNGRRKPPKIWPEIDIRLGNWLIIATVAPRNLFLEVGGFIEYAWSEDWSIWARCMMAGATVVKVPEAVYTAHINVRSRNRSRTRQQVLYWHQKIGADIWPDFYEATTADEDRVEALQTYTVRRLG